MIVEGTVDVLEESIDPENGSLGLRPCASPILSVSLGLRLCASPILYALLFGGRAGLVLVLSMILSSSFSVVFSFTLVQPYFTHVLTRAGRWDKG